MLVLGISETHCATAAILRDGEIIGCASEERFSRLKNDAGYPRLAVNALLRDLRIDPIEIGLVALAGRHPAPDREWLNRMLHDEAWQRRRAREWLQARRPGLARKVRKLAARLGLAERAPEKVRLTHEQRLARVTDHLGVAADRVTTLDHHACHAAAAYFGAPFSGQPALVLTADGQGDGLCATASTATQTRLDRREVVRSAHGSPGVFYSLVTQLLGMKPGEHEYKVMGLAPYARAKAAQEAAAALREAFDLVEGQPCRFAWTRRGLPPYRALLEATLGLRFDAIAGGAQLVLEESLERWTRIMAGRYGGQRVALGGGVFMNVKANMRLAEQEWLEELFVFPSCGDESNAVGAAYLGYLDLCARAGLPPAPRPVGSACLGPDLDDAEIEAVIRRRDLAGRHQVSEHECIEEKIAEVLASGGIVARCAGRMEFGARALGNRSILADPSDPRVVPVINHMIKNRDFWMPFAPAVLQERQADYLVNPKGLASPYMMLAFATTPERREEIAAALHPQDATARAQILDRASSPGFHRVVTEFERRTGIGAVLNTSFNLHGDPMVCSPEDAVDTFERSGLPHLALGRWLISKQRRAAHVRRDVRRERPGRGGPVPRGSGALPASARD